MVFVFMSVVQCSCMQQSCKMYAFSGAIAKLCTCTRIYLITVDVL